jgi:hypothetical protein
MLEKRSAGQSKKNVVSQFVSVLTLQKVHTYYRFKKYRQFPSASEVNKILMCN